MSFRIERLNSEMRKAIADIINNRVKDPRVSAMVSVLDVSVAKDLKTAKVLVSIYGDKETVDSTFEGLHKCGSFIKTELSHEFKQIRMIPDLTFLLDKSMEYSEKINKIIEEIHHNDNN